MVSREVVVALGITAFAVGCATMSPPEILQRDALVLVMLADRIADKEACTQRKLINREVVVPPKNPGKDPWAEKWTIDRCGTLAYYGVNFTPNLTKGGTDISVSGW